MRKKDKIKWLILAWTIALFGGIVFWLLRLTKRNQVKGCKDIKLNSKPEGLILAHNHPSLWEPILLPFLFFPKFLFNLNFIPFITPDRRNFFEKWWFLPFRQVCLPIPRGDFSGEIKILREMKETLEKGRILILAPEGGRTFKGKDFKVIEKGTIKTSDSQEEINGKKRIRRFKRGIGWLVLNTKAKVLLVWTEGGDKVIPNSPSIHFVFPKFWKKTIFKIKEVPELSQNSLLSEDEIIEFLEDTMLKLGDGV